MNIAIPLRRVVGGEFVEALKALSRAKGLDVKHNPAIARAIRQAKDAAADYGETLDALREKHGGEANGGFIVFDKAGDKAASQVAKKAFQLDLKAVLETPVEFGLTSAIKLPEGLTADHAAELLEFFEPEQP